MRDQLDPEGAVKFACEGPSWSGRCPLQEDGMPVGCAGRGLLVERGDGGRFVFTVRPGAASCPLISLGPDPHRRTWIVGRLGQQTADESKRRNGVREIDGSRR